MPGTLGKSAGSPSGAAPLGLAAVLPVAIAVGASPFTYTAGANIEQVFLQSVAATTITVARRGVGIVNQVSPAATNSTVSILLGPGEAIVVTYGGAAPVMIKDTP